MKTTQVKLTEKELQYLIEVVEQQELQIKDVKRQDAFVKFVEGLRKNLTATESKLSAAGA